MSLLSDILSTEQIDELYAAGFAVIPRGGDPFEIPPALIKPDWVYQWNERPSEGWHWVKHEEHPGWFAPPGTSGPIVVSRLGLFRKLKTEVEEFHRENRKKVTDQLEAWSDRFGMFTGGATVLQTDGEEVVRTNVVAGKGVDVKIETYERPTTKTVEMVSKVPKDMLEHIDAIFAERDAIRDRTVRADRTLDPDSVITRDFYNEIERDKGAPWWPTLNAIILPYAIEAVRHRLKESTS